jgi:hypothetical protein
VSSTRQTIESALQENLVDDDQNPVHVRLLPGLSKEDLDDFARSLPVPPSRDIRELNFEALILI